MRDSSWFRRLEVALGFDAGFEIFLLIGRGELARPALARVAEELGRASAVQWHRLHLDGLAGLLADEQPQGVLHLVHGFERMPRDAAIDVAARLNVNRDRLEVLRGPVIFWIPADFYEELLRQAPDFVAWRSQASVVVEDDLELSDEVVAEQFAVCRTLVAAAPALARVPAFDVVDEGVRRPVLEWLREGAERSLRCSAQDGAPELLAWCAGMLARLYDAGEREFVPLLLPALLLDLAEHVGRGDGVLEGLRRLRDAGRLQIVVAVLVSMEERASLISQVGENHVVLAVTDGGEGLAEIAAFDDAQIRAVVDLSLTDLETDERARWRSVALEVLGALEQRVDHFAQLAKLLSYWRGLGVVVVSSQSRFLGWRDACMEIARTEVEPDQTRAGPMLNLTDIFAYESTVFAGVLLAFGVHGEGDVELTERSVSLFRAEQRPTPRVEFVEALVAHAEQVADEALELLTWMEAASLARVYESENPMLLLRALEGLGSAEHLHGDQGGAAATFREAIALAERAGALTALLWWRLANCHIAQGEDMQGLIAAQRGLQELDEIEDQDGWREKLLKACAEACSNSSMEDRALEYHAEWLELRRNRSPHHWIELARFAQRLLRAGKLDRALTVIDQAIELLHDSDDFLRYSGGAETLLRRAEIQRARGDHQATIAALRDAVRFLRAELEYRGPGWSQQFLASILLELAAELDQLDRDAAVTHMREAVELLEQVDQQPGRYPVGLADALTQLGDHATARGMHAFAATAYARVLSLAAPFPARESEALADVERRLRETCRAGGIAVEDALQRGQQPLEWPS